jgi:endo-1,4-beta-xylanase
MKIKNIVTVLLVAFILASCAPAAKVVPTEKAIPTSTFTFAPPTFTPTLPTSTPTLVPPVETLSVTQKSVSQFANALETAGISISAEQIIQQGLLIQTIVGADGKQYDIATAHIDPDPSQAGESLEGDYPLVIKKEMGEWEIASQRNICTITQIECGSVGAIGLTSTWISDHAKVEEIIKDGTIYKEDYSFMWQLPDEQKVDSLRPTESTFYFASLNKFINFTRNNDLKAAGQTLLVQNPYFLPQWLLDISNSKNPKKLMDVAQNHIRTIIDKYPNVVEWTVLSELENKWIEHHPWVGTFGLEDEQWIVDVYKTAKEADPNAKLVYSDFDIEFGGEKSNRIFKVIQKAKNEGAPIDIIAFQMHINARDLLNTPAKFESLANEIKRYKDIGIEVQIGEMDVSMVNISSDPMIRSQIQSEIVKQIIKTALENGVREFYFFGFNDLHSWKNDTANLGGPDADATLFDDNSNKKLSYYVFLQSCLDYYLK